MRSAVMIMLGSCVGVALGCGNETILAPKMPAVPGDATLDLYDDVVPIEEPTYANVAKLLRGDPANNLDDGLCAYSGCHSGIGHAGLSFRRRDVLDEAQVYKALVEGAVGTGPVGPRFSCEYHPLRRVEPGDPSKSWLYIKLVGATDDENRLDLVPADDWDDTMSPCSDNFPGAPMPYPDGGLTFPLEPAELRMIAEWILNGAPGPISP